MIRWEGTGAVTLFTRSGNTEKPDDTWTDWAGPYDRSEGQAIQSPAARFVQWKAVLGRSAAALDSSRRSLSRTFPAIRGRS